MFIYKTKITFNQCDPAGILFFANMFSICHNAYEALIESFNLQENFWNNDQYAVPLVNAECNYKKPLKYNDEIEVKIQIEKISDSSFVLDYLVTKDNSEVASVKTVHVFVAKSSFAKLPIPEYIKEKLDKFLK